MKSKKNIVMLTLVIAISLFGITYAFFDYYKLLDVNQEIISGRVSLTLAEGKDTISVSNVFPMSAEKARARADNFITFTITGHNTTLDNDIYYEIMLNEGDEETGMTRFNPYDLCFDLVEIDSEGNRTYVFEQMSFEDFDERRIWVNTVDRETEVDISRTYELRMWLSEDVRISDTNPNRDYPATGFENYYASVKVSVFGDFAEKEISYKPNYMARTSDTQFWPTEIFQLSQAISEVKFVAMGETELNTRYEASSIKADVTAIDSTVQQTSARQLSTKAQTIENTKGGKVYAWLEVDTNNEGMYVMYVSSDGITYFPSDCSLMFNGFMNSTKFTFENINTSEVTDMGGMFFYCFNIIELDLRKFDTSNVTTFTKNMTDPYGVTMPMGMFDNCVSLNKLNMIGWDTSKATNMSRMFAGCGSLISLSLSHFNTSSVTDMSEMFVFCSGLTSLDLSNFDTSKVTNMSSMFNYCKGLTTLNINGFDTSNVLDMSSMFYDCRSLTSLNVSHFDTSKVTDMSVMFVGLQSLLELDVSNFDTSKVTNMSGMFSVSNDFGGGGLGITTLDVSNFDTSKVTNMFGMFQGCKNVTRLDVSNWDVGKVNNMSALFNSCGVISLDLSKWDTSSVTDMSSMFMKCTSLVSLNLNGWVTDNVIGEEGVDEYGDVHIYGGMQGMFANCSSLTSLDLSSFRTSQLKTIENMFKGCTNLKKLNIVNFNFEVENIRNGEAFAGMPDNAEVIVGSTAVQNYILGLNTLYRPAAWTTENIIIGS